MKKKIMMFSVIIAVIFMQGFAIGAEEQVTPEKSKEIIEKIRTMTIPRAKKYRGVESKRNVEVKEYDSSGKLIVTHKFVAVRKDYFYEPPESKVLKYEKNGKDTKPTDYKEFKIDPTYPVFDKNGEQYYETAVVAVQVIGGVKCYKVKVTPKQATSRHFSGHIYYKTDDLEPHVAEGTLGKLPWPFKEFYMRFYFVKQKGYPIFRSGVITMKADVPVLFADHKFDTTIDVIESKPIPY